MGEGNIFFLLELVDKYNCKSLAGHCGEYLAANFDYVWEDDKKRLLGLSVDTWVGILRCDDLAIQSELKLFEVVMEYVNLRDDPEERKATLETLLPHLRYNFFPVQYLAQVVEKDPLLSSLPLVHNILFETYRFKVYLHLSSLSPLSLSLCVSFAHAGCHRPTKSVAPALTQ